MNRREFLKSASAAIIAVSIPDIVTGAVKTFSFSQTRKTFELQLRDVKIIDWQKEGKVRVAIVRAIVPFKNDCCYVQCSISERLLDHPQGLDILIKDLMTAAKICFKRDKGIDIAFEGYKMPSKIKDVSGR